MTDRVTVSADRTRLLPPNAPEKGYRITREEAAELGLVESAEKPVQERRTSTLAGSLRNPEQVGPTATKPKRRYTKRK
jgi:hypothetical protein